MTTPTNGDVDGRGAVRDTTSQSYTDRLQCLESARWKQRLNVQAPFRWNVRRLNLGRTLDVGCGIGRNLAHLDGNAVGVDHNSASVEIARFRGFEAYTPEEFQGSRHGQAAAFDSILLAHVVEHMQEHEAVDLLVSHLPVLRPGGKVVFICPQEKGYRTDASHVRFCGYAEIAAIASRAGLVVCRQYSFPLPRLAGRVFPYNEFVVVTRLLAGGP